MEAESNVHILQEPPSKHHHQNTWKMYNCSETMLLVDRIELVGRVFPHDWKWLAAGHWKKGGFCHKPLKKDVLATTHYNLVSICS